MKPGLRVEIQQPWTQEKISERSLLEIAINFKTFYPTGYNCTP